jgi:cytochrome c2
MKQIKIATIGLISVLILSGIFVYIQGSLKENIVYTIQEEDVIISSDSISTSKGAALYKKLECNSCHGEKLEGRVFINNFVEGVFAGSNLTKGEGGIAKYYTPSDMAKAIRHAIKKDGKPILYMPSEKYYSLDDEEITNLISYIYSVEPINNAPPKSYAGLYSIMQNLFGNLDVLFAAEKINHNANRDATLVPEISANYGRKVAKQCMPCHGNNFAGGNRPGFPVQPQNLTPNKESGLGDWTYEEFKRAMVEGISKDGRKLNPFMPYEEYASTMTKVELEALWLYLQTLPSKEYGVKN